MFEMLIFAMILFMMNVILIYKPVPILAFPLEIFILYL